MNRLILVGTVHSDPHGYRRTLQLLERLQPQLILVELSPFGLTFRRTRQRVLHATLRSNLIQAAAQSGLALRQALNHPQIRSVSRQLSPPFEYRAAVRFGRRHGARLLLVDDSRFSRYWVTTWPQLLAGENLRYLLSLPATTIAASTAYTAAAGQIERKTGARERRPIPVSREDERWAERERVLAARIHRAMQRQQPDSAVYLGGWRHLTEGGVFPTLRELLQVPRQQCVLLGQTGSGFES